MIDHVLGRPSVKFRKYQVFLVVFFWSFYLYKGDRNGPPIIRRISSVLSRRLTAWQTLVITLLWLYVARNFGKLVGLECPEPLANLYNRSYFRATWVTTALDAGFWSAMRIQRKWLRDVCSMIFSVYYLICAEQADEKVRKVRGSLTLDHLRVSWNKGTTPCLAFLSSLLRPRLMRYPPRAIRIPRPHESSYKEPVHAWLYFDGPISALKKHTKIVLDIPGGGFIAMDPRNHDDKLIAWAGRTGLPVLSLDYKKAPEHPYPYALNECYDAYHTIIASRGRCVGLSGEVVPQIVVSGDSAGGNLAVGMVLMILQSASTDASRWHGGKSLPPPVGMVLIYPTLDMNIGNWMTDEQMALIRDRRTRKTNLGIIRRKSEDYRKLDPNTPHHSDDEYSDTEGADRTPPTSKHASRPTSPPSSAVAGDTPLVSSPQTMIHLSAGHTGVDHTALPSRNSISSPFPSDSVTPLDVQKSKSIPQPTPPPQHLKTRLAMSSMISYFNDRILTPEMMRAMIILYIGPHHRPDFSTDYFLSPLLAPENLLSKFPKTYFLTGERDPLVDDTVIFAGRIRAAKLAYWQERKDLGLVKESEEFRDEDHVEVCLVQGISHGFLQFVGIFPEGWRYVFRCAKWMGEIFETADRRDAEMEGRARLAENAGIAPAVTGKPWKSRHHHRQRTWESSGDEEPLEMSTSLTSRGGRNARRRGGERVRGFTKMNGIDPEAQISRHRNSLVSLASEDDLLGRRMKGLTGNLMGLSGVDEVPPTP